jgi:hypothetical protein
MSENTTIRRRIHFRTVRRRQVLMEGPVRHLPTGRVPRVARLMALAIRLENLVNSGQAKDYATLARVAHVSRARITQITHLTLLAPDIQETVLFLPRVQRGRDPIIERDLRPIAAVADWPKQRQMWRQLKGDTPAEAPV